MQNYNIIGTFMQVFGPNGLFMGENLQHEACGNLTGKLMDAYGPSEIIGTLNNKKGRMDFNKTYENRPPIIYGFEKQVNGIWAGKYYIKGRLSGEALCELFTPGEEPKFDWHQILEKVRMSARTTEEWAKDFVNGMVGDGWFYETIDPETGEILLRPSENPPSQ